MIKEALDSMKFEQNELAYLAVTSKIESYMRDRIFNFFVQNLVLKGSRKIPSREFNRIDLALIQDNELENIIELKAGYVFDVLMKDDIFEKKVLKWVEDDFNKSVNNKYLKKYSSCTQQSVLFLTDIKNQNKIDSKYNRIIKYNNSINRFLKIRKMKMYNDDEIFDLCNQKIVDGFLKNRNDEYKVSSGILDEGEAFGITVNTYYWIIEKVRNSGSENQFDVM